MESLTKEDWTDWLSMPTTKAFLKAVEDEQKMMLMYVVKREDMDSYQQARAIGVMSGLQKVLDFEYTDGQN
jgi:hypothetical protein